MPLNQKFGKLVLIEEIESDPIGVSYLAARLGPSGLDRIVTLLRYSDRLSSHTEARERLMDKARQTARLPLPGLLRVLGIGRADRSFYASFELMEGRTLRTVIDRARREGFPFAADNALMVTSRAAVVLEALHARQDEAGKALYHGFLEPSHLIVSWVGDVKLTGLGLWAGLRNTDLMGEDRERYLAPEQAAGEPGDARSDVHGLALVLLEMLTGRPPDGSDPLSSLGAARYTTATGEEEAIPEPIEEILRIGLAPNPSSRYPTVGEMRKAIDTLLFSGDFTPTTFNLAFFMHSLFREDMERESATLEEASLADYSEFLPANAPPPTESRPEGAIATGAGAHTSPAETEPGAAPPSGSALESDVEPPAEPGSPPAPREPEPELQAEKETLVGPAPDAPAPVQTSSTPVEMPSQGEAPPLGVRAPAAPAADSGRRRPGSTPRATRGREGSLRFTRAAGPKRGGHGLSLAVGLVLAVGVGGGLGYLSYTRTGPFSGTPSPTTLSPDAAAALARVRELEARLADLEREKAQMEVEAESRVEQEAEAGPPAPDPLAARQAAESARAEARRREQARRARREEEIRDLERELRGAEQRLLTEQRATQEALQDDRLEATLPAVSPPPPTPKPVPPPVRPGDLVAVSDPGLTPPTFLSGRPAGYPLAALRLRREGSVRVEALVDERGQVVDARVLESSARGLGFEDAALRQVRTRRYQPGIKNGVAVRVWIVILVKFTL